MKSFSYLIQKNLLIDSSALSVQRLVSWKEICTSLNHRKQSHSPDSSMQKTWELFINSFHRYICRTKFQTFLQKVWTAYETTVRFQNYWNLPWKSNIHSVRWSVGKLFFEKIACTTMLAVESWDIWQQELRTNQLTTHVNHQTTEEVREQLLLPHGL